MSQTLKPYEKRFIKEYSQLSERIIKLGNLIAGYEAGTLSFIPKCPLPLLRKQYASMCLYLECLKSRAQIEHIDLPTCYEIKFKE